MHKLKTIVVNKIILKIKSLIRKKYFLIEGFFACENFKNKLYILKIK